VCVFGSACVCVFASACVWCCAPNFVYAHVGMSALVWAWMLAGMCHTAYSYSTPYQFQHVFYRIVRSK